MMFKCIIRSSRVSIVFDSVSCMIYQIRLFIDDHVSDHCMVVR